MSNEAAAQYCGQYYIMASSMAVRCCLCLRELSETSAFKKRNCFTANNVTGSQKVFNEVLLDSEELQLSVNSFLEETMNSKAYLCHLCDAYAVPFLYYRLLTSLGRLLTPISAHGRSVEAVTEI